MDAACAQRFVAEVQRSVGALAIEHRHARTCGHISLSVGVARTPRLEADAIATLIANADKAVYVA